MPSTGNNTTIEPEIRTSRTPTVLYWCALALLAGVIILGLTSPLLTLGRFIPLDTNEGWNAYFGQAAIEGGQLYPPHDALITNNYPPLSFYIVGGAGRLLGDNIFAGRLIALFSLLFVCWSIYYWLRRTVAEQRPALFGAGVFLAYAVMYGRDYIGMDDPQWLAHAMMMGGFLLFWRGMFGGPGSLVHGGEPGTLAHGPASLPRTRDLIAASIVMIAAGLTKHLLVPLPLTVTVWLLWRSRWAFAKWAVCCAVVLAATLLLAWWLYGAPFFDNLLAPRVYLRHQAISRTIAALRIFWPVLVLWLVTLIRGRLDQRVTFVSLYLAIAGVIGIGAIGGVGVDVNAFFDAMIAVSLMSGLALETLGSRAAGFAAPAIAAVAAVVSALWIANYARTLAPGQLRGIATIQARERSALADIELIREQGRGRAACEQPTLCYWANSRFMVDFFYLGQRLNTGALPLSACTRAFEGSEIALVQLEANLKYRQRVLPEYCNDIITSHYRAVRESSWGTFLVPITPAARE
jgi:hypothetical protein